MSAAMLNKLHSLTYLMSKHIETCDKKNKFGENNQNESFFCD